MRTPSIAMGMLLAFGSKVLAEAPKSVPAQPAPSEQTAHPLVLASADSVPNETLQSARPTPVQPRHPIARVTTCRCGDAQPDNVAEDSEQ